MSLPVKIRFGPVPLFSKINHINPTNVYLLAPLLTTIGGCPFLTSFPYCEIIGYKINIH